MDDSVIQAQRCTRHAFAHEWMKENRRGRPRFQELAAQTKAHQIERVGTQLREMMPWLAEGRLVDKAKN